SGSCKARRPSSPRTRRRRSRLGSAERVPVPAAIARRSGAVRNLASRLLPWDYHLPVILETSRRSWMNRQLKRIGTALLLAVTLSACSMFTPPQANRLLFGMEPSNELGYEVSGTGITVESRTLLL